MMARSLVLASMLALVGCGGSAVVESIGLDGADDTVTNTNELASSVPVGSTLKATTSVNMRSGPSTNYKVLLVVPEGAKVTTVETTSPNSGFYKVKYNGTTGWSHGAYYTLVASGGTTTPPPSASTSARDAAIGRAKSAVGFSYWWGHARFLPAGPTSGTAGSCSGNCPSCSHGGSYGGDCSGLAAKVWQVGSSNTDLTVDKHPYSTYNFDNERTYWHSVSRASIAKADAMVYNANGSGHIFVFESGDGWGSMWAYECKGCAYGCVRNLRTTSNDYTGISKNGY
ncbi:MAG TPA: SH3 domain-containing protein [Myxococcales bacterium]|jgi:hypothetical protein